METSDERSRSEKKSVRTGDGLSGLRAQDAHPEHGTTTLAPGPRREFKRGAWARWVVISVAVIAVGTGIVAWGTDFVTMQGEWTIYTAKCEGQWKGTTCIDRKSVV